MILRTLVFGSTLCGALLFAQSRRAVVVDIPQNNPFTSAADLEADLAAHRELGILPSR